MDQNIFRLYIPMDDISLFQESQGYHHLSDEALDHFLA